MFTRLPCFLLLIWFAGCDQAVPRSASVAEERAIQQARLYCRSNGSDFGWLRQRIRLLERAPFAQQQYLLAFRVGTRSYFAAGSTPPSVPASDWFDCRGRSQKPVDRMIRTGTIIYAPPIHRR